MKTVNDLNDLIPELIRRVLDNPELGDSKPETNWASYEENGWCIEICYECRGVWEHDFGDYRNVVEAWGEVTEISASHCDEDTGEETEFSGDNLNELWSALDKSLEKIK